jgi:hypothetical protein
MTDDEFIASFEDCSLANAAFHHADHVKMAFLYLCRYPAWEAIQRFSTSLSRFATAHGKPKLFHETITWAFLLLIRERMARAGGCGSWTEFAAGNQDLLSWTDNVLKRYYRDETLSSDLARSTFLLPDRGTTGPELASTPAYPEAVEPLR